ncbi:MAG: cupin domain-containing protein [Gammaproteobacteria bacterium]|nr:cupin domain-containing protein [Gammaproteobacteria bacterium]
MNAKHGLLLLMLALASTAAEAPAPIVVLPDRLTFTTPPAIPDLKTAYVLGAESQPGTYAIRVRLKAGGRVPVHTHPDTRYSTVLSGTLYVGFGATTDDMHMTAVPAGAVYVAPANVPHHLWAKDGEVVYQEAGVGPTGTKMLATP